MREYIARLIDSKDLSREEAHKAMTAIMEGGVSDSLISAFLTALKIKGETVDEISGFSEAMLEKAKKVIVKGKDLVDTCGTGGDELNTFNISTTAAFIAAGAGVNIAKHGNRSVSSRSGSADVLESCGVNIELDPDAVAKCIDEVGFGFIYARMAHSAMKYVAPVRQELGMRTVFNILGPITNPAMANGRVLGVYDISLLGVMAGALRNLGVERAFIINSENGMDELSTASKSKVVYLENGYITEYILDPAKLGFERADISALKGGDARQNAVILKDILSGRLKGPMRDTAVLNAAAAIIAGKLADRMEDSLKMAVQSIEDGKSPGKTGKAGRDLKPARRRQKIMAHKFLKEILAGKKDSINSIEACEDIKRAGAGKGLLDNIRDRQGKCHSRDKKGFTFQGYYKQGSGCHGYRQDYMAGFQASYRDSRCLRKNCILKGMAGDIGKAKKGTGLPILRKDFIFSKKQVYESAALGADCILLIKSLLGFKKLRILYECAREAGLDVLVETHHREELLAGTGAGRRPYRNK